MEYLRDNFRCLTGPVNGGQVSLASDYPSTLAHNHHPSALNFRSAICALASPKWRHLISKVRD